MQGALVSYSQRNSPWHRWDARCRLAAVVIACLAVSLLHSPAAAGAALLASVLLLASARVPWSWFVARLAGVGLFLSLFLALLPLTVPGEEWRLGPLALSARGLALATALGLKALAVVALALFLFATAPLERTLKAARALRVPGLAVQLLMLTHRHVELLADELHKLRIALRLKGFRNRAGTHAYRTLGNVTGMMLVRSYERAERVGQAMRCRGFDGKFRALEEFRGGWPDFGLALLFLTLAAGLPWLVEAIAMQAGPIK
jgi:cobalt/nickel transport system permease protein